MDSSQYKNHDFIGIKGFQRIKFQKSNFESKDKSSILDQKFNLLKTSFCIENPFCIKNSFEN